MESILRERGGCEDKIESRIKTLWGKWMEVTEMVCDKRMPDRLIIMIYCTIIRLVIINDLET